MDSLVHSHIEALDVVGNAVVVGLGRGGLSCAEHLVKEGWDVEVADSRERPPLERMLHSELPGVPLHKGPIRPRLFLDANLVAICPGLDKDRKIAKVASKYGARVVSNLDIFAEKRNRPVIAIAGKNGKSTVTQLIKDCLEKQGKRISIGGVSHVPVLDLLSRPNPDSYIIELSPLMLKHVKTLNADVAVVLNSFTPLINGAVPEEMKNRSLTRIFNGAQNAVVNRDDEYCTNTNGVQSVVTFGLDAPPSDCDYGIAEDSDGRWFARGDEKLFQTASCSLLGRHNERNILAALAVLEALGCQLEDVIQHIRNFSALKYRCNYIGSWNGVRWINDSKSDNASSTQAAVQSAGDNAVLITGGITTGLDFAHFDQDLIKSLRSCVVFGQDARKIGQYFADHVKTIYVDNLYDGVCEASKRARPGTTVVFSPGCESHDMFTDFLHRGQVFTKAVEYHHS